MQHAEFTGQHMDQLELFLHKRSGAATECCERVCSYDYLKGFCLPEEECRPKLRKQ